MGTNGCKNPVGLRLIITDNDVQWEKEYKGIFDLDELFLFPFFGLQECISRKKK